MAARFRAMPDTLATLPGIGRSTAAAIATFAFGAHAPILDGNVKRVLARHAGIDGWPGLPKVEALLWQCAEARMPARDGEAYTQGLMDLGATVCTRSGAALRRVSGGGRLRRARRAGAPANCRRRGRARRCRSARCACC